MQDPTAFLVVQWLETELCFQLRKAGAKEFYFTLFVLLPHRGLHPAPTQRSYTLHPPHPKQERYTLPPRGGTALCPHGAPTHA